MTQGPTVPGGLGGSCGSVLQTVACQVFFLDLERLYRRVNIKIKIIKSKLQLLWSCSWLTTINSYWHPVQFPFLQYLGSAVWQVAHGALIWLCWAKWAADQFWKVMSLAAWWAVDITAAHQTSALNYCAWQGGVGADAPAARFAGKDQTCAGNPGSWVPDPLRTSVKKGFEMQRLWKSKFSNT